MTTKQIMAWLEENDLTLMDVINACIDDEGIIGVGLITLADNIAKQIKAQLHTDQHA